MTSASDFFGPHASFDDILTVHPTQLSIPFDFNEEHLSCSIQLTNITDRIVAYRFSCPSWGIDLVSPDEDTYVGTILPRSTSSVTLTVKLGKDPRPLKKAPPEWIDIWAYVVKDGVKAEDITCREDPVGIFRMPVVYYNPVVPAANPYSAIIGKDAVTTNMTNMTNKMLVGDKIRKKPTPDMTSDSDFFGLVTVHPTKLHIPFELNKDNYSCSIQLTNITDRIVAYRFSSSRRRLLVSPDDDRCVGTILPRSTSTVTLTVTLKLLEKPPENTLYKYYFDILFDVAKDGVKAEDITCKEDFLNLTGGRPILFRMLVVYDDSTVPAANPNSAVVREENEKRISLLNIDDNNSINDEVHEMTSKGKGLVSSVRSPQSPRSPQDIEGSVSSFRRQSPNEMSSPVLFSDQEIKGATNGLSDSSKIGQGEYWTVYKGSLHDTEVAIKMLDLNSDLEMNEFLQQMEVLGQMRHRNLIKLIGACVSLRALIFEFVPNGSLEDCLQNSPRLLTWKMRTHIVYDICSSLTFLHSIKPQPVIHGDLNPANILLDGNFVSKLVNFGLYRFLSGGTANDAFLDTKPKGTLGYIDPEFLKTGILTIGYDVYSFGVTILRLLTGMDALGTGLKVRSAYKKKLLMEMVDPKAGQWPTHVSELLAYFGLACCARKKSPGLLMEIAKDLQKILDIVD